MYQETLEELRIHLATGIPPIVTSSRVPQGGTGRIFADDGSLIDVHDLVAFLKNTGGEYLRVGVKTEEWNWFTYEFDAMRTEGSRLIRLEGVTELRALSDGDGAVSLRLRFLAKVERV